MFKIENETDLHCKVVHLIRNYYPKALIEEGVGENHDMVLNYHKDYNGLCTKFKSPTNNYQIGQYKTRTADCGLRTADCGPRTADWV